MKLSSALVVIGCCGTVMAEYEWVAPGATDRRSPCPMVNALANHAYLPHDGLNISLAVLSTAFSDAVNLAPAATAIVGASALRTSTTGYADTFNLDDLNTHGILEHDGSLSRADIYFGDNHSFNSTIWDVVVAASFSYPTITLAGAIAARKARFVAAAAVNPTFNMTATDTQNSAIESALYMSVFDVSGGAGTEANSEWIKVLFEQEKLPSAEGWVKSATELTAAGILGLVATILKG